jgi:hypothetical protein
MSVDHILEIHNRCERLIDAAVDALAEPLSSQDGEILDSPEARTILTGTLNAARLLVRELEAAYDFNNFGSELKEATCPD